MEEVSLRSSSPTAAGVPQKIENSSGIEEWITYIFEQIKELFSRICSCFLPGRVEVLDPTKQKEKIQNLEQQITTLKEQLDQTEEIRKALNEADIGVQQINQYRSLQNQTELLQQGISTAKSDLEKSKQEQLATLKKMETMENILAPLQQHDVNSAENVETLFKTLESQKTRLNELEEQVRSFEEIKAALSAADIGTKQINDYRQSMEEMSNLQARVIELQSSLQSVLQEKSDLLIKIESMRAIQLTLSEHNVNSPEAIENLVKISKEVEHLKEEKEKLEEQMKSLNNIQQVLTQHDLNLNDIQQLPTLLKEKAQWKTDLEKLEAVHNFIEKDLKDLNEKRLTMLGDQSKMIEDLTQQIQTQISVQQTSQANFQTISSQSTVLESEKVKLKSANKILQKDRELFENKLKAQKKSAEDLITLLHQHVNGFEFSEE